MHFDWSSYCESVGSQTVPEESLPHYISSLTTLLTPGSLLELQTGGQWRLGLVKLVCDPLVQVSLLDQQTSSHISTEKLWVNTESQGLFRFGHCGDTGGQELESCYQWCQDNNLTDLYPPLQQSFPAGSGLSPLTRLRAGQKFELQDEACPQHFWRVTATQNRAGILELSLDSPGQTATTDLHLHMLDQRLQPCGTVQATNLASFSPPESLRALDYPEQVWTELGLSFAQSSPDETKALGLAPEPLKKHKFEERMLLAVIDPHCQDRFRVAIVERVLDQFYFEISLLEQSTVKIVCNSRSRNLVHLGWAIGEKFLAKAALQNMPCSKLSKIAPKHLFNILDRTIPTVEVGQKLEFCSSFSEKIFHLASIVDIRGHILILEVLTENGKETKLTPVKNLHLFPAGFAEANNFKFYIPEHLKEFNRDQEEDVYGVKDDKAADDGNIKTDNSSDDLKPSFFVRPVASLESRETSWCPPIYFNHLCYSASFLSKHRLESLPRFIGSGPVRLVMREVLSRLIGASFKSGAVLKKLEVGEESVRRPQYWLEPMKGKSRVLALQADIEIPSLAGQVAGFCREVCQKLSCCPYLFGPQRVGEECPSACNTRPKSDFQAEGETAFKIVRRGRRGRKRQKVVVSSEKGEGGGGESSNAESGTSSPSCSNTVTTNTTRDNSPDQTEGSAKRKNKNWGDILPPSEMKTRGAKLPSFSMQLKKRPSRKDVEELERLIASKCDSSDPDSPPRPPSPRLLRSKTATSMTDLVRNGRNYDLDYPHIPSFSFHDIPDTEPLAEAPPVWRVCLQSSPLAWSPADVAHYVESQEDVAHLAQLFINEEVDGEAFLLLNLPTLLEHWKLNIREAITLSRHIESVKFAFYNQFAFEENSFDGYSNGGGGRGG